MIYILHGDNILASYSQLQNILKNYQDFEKVRLSADKNSQEDYYLSVFTEDILNQKKVIILENFLSAKKINFGQIGKIPKDVPVLFWEKSAINTGSFKKSPHLAIEEFKPVPALFYFLDSISDDPAKSINYLNKLDNSSQAGLIWHLTGRILLLILVKLNISKELASRLVGRQVADWQWQKLSVQARIMSLTTLFRLYDALLKLDFMIKTGTSNLDENTLIPFLLLKYLRSN